LILPRADGVLDAVTGGQASVGLRVPSQPVAHALLEALAALGCDGIAAPSANRFGQISATTAGHVAEEFGGAIALILDGGPSHHGIESTIVDFSSGDPVVLRPGSITSGELARVLGGAPRSGGAGATRASGTLASHYAPHTPAKLLPRNELLAAIAGLGGANAHISVLAHSVAQPPEFEGAWFDAPGESARYAQQLYANLRALDAREADEIWIEAPPDGPDWVAIGDRLRRATHRD
jgi:L-threonylcarbamoyladenylate synthase